MIVARTFSVVILLANFTIGAVSAQVSKKAPGCWRISFSPWSPSPRGDSILYQPAPDTVRLSIERFDSSYFRATCRPNVVPQSLRESLDSLRAFWRPIGRDSIELWFPVWWSTGVLAHLRLAGDTLRGRGWVYVDYSPYETPYSNVRAVRCGGA